VGAHACNRRLMELSKVGCAQVATQPAVAYFFREILATSLGCEIYVRKAVNYFPDTARDSEEAATSFRTIQEGARLHSETAIGCVCRSVYECMFLFVRVCRACVYELCTFVRAASVYGGIQSHMCGWHDCECVGREGGLYFVCIYECLSL
jgi:hypothetical protein